MRCPNCQFNIQPEWYFCPNCGKLLKEKPISISILKQITIYFISFFLAPFGLAWGFKYIRNPDRKVKLIGLVSILLTILSIGLLITIFKNFMDQYAQILNNYGVIPK
ncbi:zinc ribbon domain-containing protein [Candidatus Roizmanbacteria bacterium]|nr:zinc ribbon domain-containing protein [Candidatus Roizmanbacteria bacterium]